MFSRCGVTKESRPLYKFPLTSFTYHYENFFFLSWFPDNIDCVKYPAPWCRIFSFMELLPFLIFSKWKRKLQTDSPATA